MYICKKMISVSEKEKDTKRKEIKRNTKTFLAGGGFELPTSSIQNRFSVPLQYHETNNAIDNRKRGK